VTAKVLAIIRREYIERVRTRWFLIATFALPVVIVALMLLPEWLISRGGAIDTDFRVGVLDRSYRLAADLNRALDSGWSLEPVDFGRLEEESALRDSLLASNLNALLILSPTIAEGGEARLLTRRAVSSRRERALNQGIRDALVTARLNEWGVADLNAERLLARPPLEIVQVSSDGEKSREVFQAIAMVFAVVTYMMLLIYGQLIVRAVLEEKTSNIVEVMVSSVRPWEMMLGKMIGVGAVGLTQIGIWAAITGLLALYGLPGLVGSLASEGIDIAQIDLPIGLFVWAFLYFVLGYFLYAGLFLAAGASLSNEQDAQQVVTPLVVIIVVGFILVISVIESPDSSWAVAGSLIPLFSPMIVPARLAITHVRTWELAASLLLLAVGLVASAWLAGRIYRVGILMRGKRPNLPELVRWVRHG
jgi:ABC-2 type transport system permease protein